ncbi:kynurenine formamidase [Anopheles gambiae]|uniref:kynurenine formamidase n=1 Tax=Anopheles gambiae TaxID=7165 RepID=UPI002AC8A246|nr:kynurenine formamidase [Anopheles gambiae]
MAKQIGIERAGGEDRLITHYTHHHRRCRSLISRAVLVVLCFALAANQYQSGSGTVVVAAAAAASTTTPPVQVTRWLGKLSRYVQFRGGKTPLTCQGIMEQDGPPSESTLITWEKQYSPSAWSVRFPTPAEVIDYHVKFVKSESDKNREQLETLLDVPYGSGDRDKVDIYGENLPPDAPLFVYVHGGYWQMLEKETSAYPAKPLVDRGVRVMIVGYELCPEVTLEELVRQMKAAGEFVLNYATENGVRHISIAGHSAGAHLIASMLDRPFMDAVGEELALLKDVYLISGVYNVQELRYTKSVNKDNLLGINDANAKSLSPLYASYEHLRPIVEQQQGGALRFHVYVAEHDSDVFREMAVKMSELLRSYGMRCDLSVLPGLDHFDIVEKLASADYTITAAILAGVAAAGEKS